MSAKEKILEVLDNNKGSYVSGEELATSIGISRAGIWKNIKSLQKEGYLIDAVAEKNKEEVLDEKEKKLLNIGIAIVAVYAIARVVVLSEKVLKFIGFDFGADDEEESEE